MIDSTKGKNNKKGKGGKKRKFDPKDICNYCKELGHWKQNCPKKAKKYYVVALVQNDFSSKNNLVLVVGEQLQQYSEQ